MNLKHWITGPTDHLTIRVPRLWMNQYSDDILTIKTYEAENNSHAAILAVHEKAERLRSENEQTLSTVE